MVKGHGSFSDIRERIHRKPMAWDLCINVCVYSNDRSNINKQTNKLTDLFTVGTGQVD